MGRNRVEAEDQQTQKIFNGIMKDFGVSEDDLYPLFLGYTKSRAEGKSRRESVSKLGASATIENADFWDRVLGYCFALTLETVGVLMVQEFEKGVGDGK